MISIIVPIYNVEEYLPKCLESIINQSYRNIEIILVDDGSPDNAGEICDEYATKDERVRVFHIPNGGVAKARQLGVENSTGDYIVFVDPDDWLPLDAIEIMYSNINPEIDIVIGNLTTNYKSDETSYKKETLRILTGDKYLNQLLKKQILFSPCAKLYRRSLFDNNSFPIRKRGEDCLMNITISPRVRSVAIINKLVYYYFSRPNSATNSTTNSYEKVKDFCLTIEQLLKDIGAYEKSKYSYLSLVLMELNHANLGHYDNGIEDDIWIMKIIDLAKESNSLSNFERFMIFALSNKSALKIRYQYYKLKHNLKMLIKKGLMIK
ncbi:MAG: glycosyltransferase family 2 protein [Rikenellaceae bacterium]